jgi:hypothetical protein
MTYINPSGLLDMLRPSKLRHHELQCEPRTEVAILSYLADHNLPCRNFHLSTYMESFFLDMHNALLEFLFIGIERKPNPP